MSQLLDQRHQVPESPMSFGSFSASDERKLRALEDQVKHLKSVAVNNELLNEKLRIYEAQQATLDDRLLECQQIEAENERLRTDMASLSEIASFVKSIGFARSLAVISALREFL